MRSPCLGAAIWKSPTWKPLPVARSSPPEDIPHAGRGKGRGRTTFCLFGVYFCVRHSIRVKSSSRLRRLLLRLRKLLRVVELSVSPRTCPIIIIVSYRCFLKSARIAHCCGYTIDRECETIALMILLMCVYQNVKFNCCVVSNTNRRIFVLNLYYVTTLSLE